MPDFVSSPESENAKRIGLARVELEKAEWRRTPERDVFPCDICGTIYRSERDAYDCMDRCEGVIA